MKYRRAKWWEELWASLAALYIKPECYHAWLVAHRFRTRRWLDDSDSDDAAGEQKS